MSTENEVSVQHKILDEIGEILTRGGKTYDMIEDIESALAKDPASRVHIEGMVSWLKQKKQKHHDWQKTAKSKLEYEDEQYLYDCFNTVLQVAEREYKEAN